jgi:hypothetical protein
VLFPTRTPASDAEKAYGFTGLTQGVNLSGYQHTPAAKVKLPAIASWVGQGGFSLLRNGSGARPVKQKYTSACTGKSHKTGSKPVVEDCAYAGLADAAQARGLKLGHYWFNGWISTIDTTPKKLFSGDYTPEASAQQFVDWLIKDGNYNRRAPTRWCWTSRPATPGPRLTRERSTRGSCAPGIPTRPRPGCLPCATS